MEPSSLPTWAQAVFYLVIAIGTAGTGVWSYLKKEQKAADPVTPAGGTGAASVISASFIDSKLLRELIEAMRELQEEQGRDAKKLHRLLQDLRESLTELNETTILQTDATGNLVRFVNRGANRGRLPEEY